VLSVRLVLRAHNSSIVQFTGVTGLAVDGSLVRSARAAWLGLLWPCASGAAVLALGAGLTGTHGRLDPAAEGSPFSWAAACAAAGAAFVAAYVAKRRGDLRVRRVALAAGLAYLALDNALGLHERLAADLDARAVEASDWRSFGLAGYGLLFAAVVCLLAVELRRSRDRRMLAAGALLLVTALAARIGGSVLAAAGVLPHGTGRDVGLALDHAAQLAGWILVAGGLARTWLAPARKRRSPPDQSETTAVAQ
jgi:hypothetical protein